MNKIKLSNISSLPPNDANKQEYLEKLKKNTKRIGELVAVMHAEGKKSILVVLQGMDASGKDGVTKNVFASCHPGAINVHSFKKPSDLEMNHDFLWRAHAQVPAKAKITIFNRSHYEDILIQRVHSWIDDKKAEARMESINAFESLITEDNNTTVLKFFLHISEERQLEKLTERIVDDTKNWKHNHGDWEERKHWEEYQKYYEYALNNSKIPWNIIPVDKNWYRDYLVSEIVIDCLEKMDCKYPVLEDKTIPNV
jgi:PPK2 family polyphosphate:nucleotide phosphotransferase